MKSLLPFALDYAQRYGWPVHPVDLEKQPTTKHGFYDATTELDLRQHRRLGLQGV
jgi:hypothetical protein